MDSRTLNLSLYLRGVIKCMCKGIYSCKEVRSNASLYALLNISYNRFIPLFPKSTIDYINTFIMFAWLHTNLWRRFNQSQKSPLIHVRFRLYPPIKVYVIAAPIPTHIEQGTKPQEHLNCHQRVSDACIVVIWWL